MASRRPYTAVYGLPGAVYGTRGAPPGANPPWVWAPPGATPPGLAPRYPPLVLSPRVLFPPGFELVRGLPRIQTVRATHYPRLEIRMKRRKGKWLIHGANGRCNFRRSRSSCKRLGLQQESACRLEPMLGTTLSQIGNGVG